MVQENFDSWESSLARATARLKKYDSKKATWILNTFKRDLAKKIADCNKAVEKLHKQYEDAMKAATFPHEKEVLKRAYASKIRDRKAALKSDAEDLFNRDLDKIEKAIKAAEKRQKKP